MLLCATAIAAAAPIPAGNAEQKAAIRGMAMRLLTYRPACDNPQLLLVFHGLSLRPDLSRKAARRLSDQRCLIVVAPLFDTGRFPTWRYQRGGIVHKGKVQDSQRWTVHAVRALVDWAQEREGRTLEHWLLGHSAGGQFLSRVAAFAPTTARRIVIASPSTHVAASLSVAAPYGLGGVYAGAVATAQLRAYLAKPVTIYLGQTDTGDKNRNDGPEALAQGATRLDRGRNVYAAAKKAADEHGWSFNWRLVEAPGVGHSANRMYHAPEAAAALSP
jgi:hypothetical protein